MVRVANRLSGKACPGRAPRATPLKIVAIAAASGNGGKRGRAIDFIDRLSGAAAGFPAAAPLLMIAEIYAITLATAVSTR